MAPVTLTIHHVRNEADSERARVLMLLAAEWPYGLTTTQLRVLAGLPHGQRLGGITRFLRNRGLAEYGHGSGGGYRLFSTQAAHEAWRLLS